MKKIIEEQTKELRGAGFFDFGRAAYGTLELELEARCGEHVEAVIGECAENGSILHRHGWTTFMLDRFALKADGRGRLLPEDGSHHLSGRLFSAGDMRTGQSLVVRALADGRAAAKEVDEFLKSVD